MSISHRGSIFSEEAKLRQSVGRTAAGNDAEKKPQRKASLRAADSLSDAVLKEEPARPWRQTASVRHSVVLAQPAPSALACTEVRTSSSTSSAARLSRLAGGGAASVPVMQPAPPMNDGFDHFAPQVSPGPKLTPTDETSPRAVQPPPTSARPGKMMAGLGRKSPCLNAANSKPVRHLNLRRGAPAANPLSQCTASLASTPSRPQKPTASGSTPAGLQRTPSAAMAGALGGRMLGVCPLDL